MIAFDRKYQLKQRKETAGVLPFLLQIMFRYAILCDFIDFIIFPRANYNNQQIIVMPDELVDHTQTSTSEFDFQEAGKISSIFVSQGFSIAAFVFRQRIFSDFLNCFSNQNFLAAIQFAEVFKGFRKVFDIPAHSNSMSSVSSKSEGLNPNS